MEINPKIVIGGLGNMKELRFLGVFTDGNINSHKNWKFDEVTQYFPNSLRCLHWHAYPFRCLPTTFQANNLGVLTMPYSRVKQLWEAGGERKVNDGCLVLHLLSLLYMLHIVIYATYMLFWYYVHAYLLFFPLIIGSQETQIS